mgnify:CR=1 FL=1
MAVLGIIQVEQGVAVDDAHGNSGNLTGKRNALELARLDPHGKGVVQRHPGAGDARRTRAASAWITSQSTVTVYSPRRFMLTTVRRLRPIKRSISMERPLRLACSRLQRLPVDAGSIAYSAVTQPALAPLRSRNALLDGGGAQHARVAKLCQARAVGVLHDAAGELNGTQLVCGAAVGAVDLHIFHGTILSAKDVAKTPATLRA